MNGLNLMLIAATMSALPAAASHVTAQADAAWSYAGINNVLSISDPFGDVFPIPIVAGETSGAAAASNGAALPGMMQDNAVLTFSNRSADELFVSLAFDYDLVFAYGYDTDGKPEPVDYDMTAMTGIYASVDGGPERILGEKTWTEVLSCSDPFFCAGGDRVTPSDSGFAFAYLDFQVDPEDTARITLRAVASMRVTPVTPPSTVVALPASASLVLGGLAALAFLRRRSGIA